MNGYPTPRCIETWSPTKWCEIVGNGKLVDHWKNMISTGPINSATSGLIGTGKTRTTHHGLRAMLCLNRTPQLDPCGECESCRFSTGRLTDMWGIHAGVREAKYFVRLLDCHTVTSQDLKDLRIDGALEDPRMIIYLDEVAALAQRNLLGEILTACDQSDATWLVSAASLLPKKKSARSKPVDPFPPEINRRFAMRESTSLPAEADLLRWIDLRCSEWGINLADGTVAPEIVRRSRQRVRHVLEVLALGALKPDRTLTLGDVRQFNFRSPI